MVAEVAQQLRGLHILVNSGSHPGGSATATGPIETVVDQDLLRDFNTKYVGALRCSRAVIPADRDDPHPPDRQKCCQIRSVFCRS
jgi:NAD(P)-dependent dehydrogenase (short-subunit alcohol dehydrogenase family)